MESARIRNFSRPYFPAFGLNTERYSVSVSQSYVILQRWRHQYPSY